MGQALQKIMGQALQKNGHCKKMDLIHYMGQALQKSLNFFFVK